MTTERTLPISAQQREFVIKVGGEAVPREHQLLSASVASPANRIASAQLVYADGSAAAGTFALGSSPLFVPGAVVEVFAGHGSSMALLFKGVVVRQRIKVRERAPSQFIVDCRHAAMKLTLARRSANHLDKSDADVMETLLGDAGLRPDVAATSSSHQQLVQHDVSDWDFIVARALANGRLVVMRGEVIRIAAPALGEPVANLQYGATLLELDAEIDARAQSVSVQAVTWSAADQALHVLDGATPSFPAAGNFDGDALAEAAGNAALDLRHTALDDAQATALANAQRLLMRVNQVSGRAKCIGIGTVLPGDTVMLAGVGDRFNGKVLVTGVRHDMDTVQGWRTQLQFGGIDEDEALRQRLARSRTANLLATVGGLQLGVVTDNEDPEGEFRVRVRLPLVDRADDGIWARVALPDAGSDRGFMVRPEIGDEVVLGFLDDDPRQPVILGMLHSSAKSAPINPTNANHEKAIVTRSNLRLHFDDDKKIITLSTPAGNTLVLDEDARAMRLTDQHGNRIEMSSEGITIESKSALTLKSASGSTLQAGSSVEIKASSELKLEGSASAELKGGGVARIQGGLVQIN